MAAPTAEQIRAQQMGSPRPNAEGIARGAGQGAHRDREEPRACWDKFAEEARKIHYGESDKRGIYGETSDKEAEALVEEVPSSALPWAEGKGPLPFRLSRLPARMSAAPAAT